MPDYLVKVTTDVALDRAGLDAVEDVVYDVVVDNLGGSTEELPVELIDGKFQRVGGITDVEATFN